MKRMMGLTVCLVAWIGLGGLTGCSHKPAFIHGSLEQYQPVTMEFNGPMLWENGPANPFTDYRMNVRFSKGNRVLDVPGYYAADGRAAETSATDGHVWRVHFLPDEPGEWWYEATLLYGLNAAIDDDAQVTRVSFSGAKGTLNIAPVNPEATGFYRTGPLRYANCRYVRFANGQPFIINGSSSPENFLACADFDGNEVADQFLQRFLPHMKDWVDEQPTWQNGKGKGIIGAVNYLASRGVNCLSVSTYNIDGGNHGDVYVWSTPDDKLHFDVSKLDQWNIVFTHMARLGMAVQLVTQEAGNDNVLGRGELRTERKLYYRELVARFAHQPGLIWNLGQNNGNTDIDRAEFAAYIRKLDPYKRPIVVHAADGKQMNVFSPLLGFHALHGVALQSAPDRVHEQTLTWINRSAERNQKWMVVWNNAADENPVAKPDAQDPNHNAARQGLWSNLLAGGSGSIWSLGADFPGNDPAGENFRRAERLWTLGKTAVDFVQEQMDLTQTVPANNLIQSSGTAYCLAGGGAYLVYLAQGQSAFLSAAPGRYEVIWLNPRTGGAPNREAVAPADEPADAPAPEAADDDEPINAVEIGLSGTIVETAGELILTPPANDGQDWVVLVRACR